MPGLGISWVTCLQKLLVAPSFSQERGPRPGEGLHARDPGGRREVKPPLWAQGLSWTRPPAGSPWRLAVALPSRSWPALVLQWGPKQVAHL